MTDKKPELNEDLIERIAQRLFDSNAKDWAGDHDTRLWDEIDEEEAREWREEATELLTPAYEQGKQAQYVETINLFNKLRNGRFQFNDEVKMVIDMLKDEITRMR